MCQAVAGGQKVESSYQRNVLKLGRRTVRSSTGQCPGTNTVPVVREIETPKKFADDTRRDKQLQQQSKERKCNKQLTT